MPTRTGLAAAASVAAGLLAVAAPVAGAAAPAPPAASETPNLQLPASTFVPPKVGPISVDIAPIIINGQVVSPALHVLKPAVSSAPITSKPPSTSKPAA
jgi:hypothetical protein